MEEDNQEDYDIVYTQTEWEALAINNAAVSDTVGRIFDQEIGAPRSPFSKRLKEGVKS